MRAFSPLGQTLRLHAPLAPPLIDLSDLYTHTSGPINGREPGQPAGTHQGPKTQPGAAWRLVTTRNGGQVD